MGMGSEELWVACYKRQGETPENLRGEGDRLSQAHIMPLTANPAIAGGAAKTNSEGGESF
jgi:hypothetical protein